MKAQGTGRYQGTSVRAQGTSRYQCTVVDEITFRGIFEIISGTILCIE